MSPDSNSTEPVGDKPPAKPQPDTSAAEAALKAKLSRKRTKTGCLTCRRRRIKCGEERPVCKNCIKSKRQCEGYNQRVVFKPPTFDIRPTPHGSAHIIFHAGAGYDPATTHQVESVHAPPPPGAAHGLDPRPVDYHPPGPQAHSGAHAAQAHAFTHARGPPSSSTWPSHPFNPGWGFPAPSNLDHPSGDQFFHPERACQPPWPGSVPGTGHLWEPPIPAGGDFTSSQSATQPQPQPLPPGAVPAFTSDRHFAEPHGDLRPAAPPPPHFGLVESVGWGGGVWASPPHSAPSIGGRKHSIAEQHVQAPNEQARAPAIQERITPQNYEHEQHWTNSDSPTFFLNAAAVQSQDDEYYDLNSDDDADFDVPWTSAKTTQRHRIVDTAPDPAMSLTFNKLYGGVLDHYRVEEVANPLKNPSTARLFAHFIKSSGPTISPFERNAGEATILHPYDSVPFAQRGLWTYTMPKEALKHQGLLHAMLALASMHVARIQHASLTPSMQHYAWALKRVHHCVGHPRERLKITTIAASMLLGFYEVTTAEHSKWNTHLSGSKQLFLETDFASLAQQFRQMKIDREARRQLVHMGYPPAQAKGPQDGLLDQMYDIDERIVSDLTGYEVRYQTHGQVMTPEQSIPPDLDLNSFGILKDLWWWYCKQDCYQSIISGNPLLLSYSRWGDCPPRAPAGRADAVYGSSDHLMLLLGRVADFGARDRKRKLRQMEVNGGQWRPAPGMNIPSPPKPPNAQANPTGGSGPPPPQGPSFFGMAPAPKQNVQMPASYQPLSGEPMLSTPSPKEVTDLQLATEAAIHEHGRIRAALLNFADSLGADFQPLPITPYDTPFGPSLSYRNHEMACVWALYYATTIIAIRSHPHMHPASHVAAGLAARETAPFANEIGRIVSAIAPANPAEPLSPSLAGCLIETTVASFFAAIQYRDARQREVTVLRLSNIAKRTGWATGEVIARGCEKSWMTAALAGRGPPYTSILENDRESDDPRLNKGVLEAHRAQVVQEDADEKDRSMVTKKPVARLNWAMGLLGLENDVEKSGA